MMSLYHVVLAQKGERKEVMDFIASIYKPISPYADRVQKITFAYEPSIDEGNMILARSLTGQLIGVIRIVEREMLVAGVRLTCGGISSVAVHTDWQRWGVCTRMMQKAIEEMARRGMDISVLHARRALDGFYTRFGYWGVGRYIDLRLLDFCPSGNVLKTVKFDRRYEKLCRRAYSKTYHPLTGSFLRNIKIWQWLLKRIEKGVLSAKIMLVVDEKNPVGYLVLKDNKLVELAVPSKFFSAVAAWVIKQKLESISIHPRHPFFLYCRQHYGTTLQERMPLNGGYMAKVINQAALLKKLKPCLVAFNRTNGGRQLAKKSLVKELLLSRYFHTCVLDEV